MSFDFSKGDLEYFNGDEWFQYGKNINSYTDLGLVVGKVQKPIMPQVQESTQDIPAMYGNVFLGNDYGELTFNIPVTIMAFDRTSYNMIVDNLRAVFTQDAVDPGVEYPLTFGDNPGVSYYGHWGQMSPPVFITPTDWQARATLTFICSQPYGYLPQQDIELEYPNQPVIPQGNGKSYPVYQIYLKKDVYHVGIANDTAGGSYVATGYTVDNDNTNTEGEKIKDNEPLDTDEEPTTLNDWIASGTENKQIMTFRIDADQAGQMGERDGGGITPAYTNHTDKNRSSGHQSVQVRNYGNPKAHKNFYGPLAIHPQFNNPTNNWCLMVNLWNQKTSTDHTSDRAMGRCDVYLLDENGHRRGKIYIQDWQRGEMPRVGFALGKSPSDDVQMINRNNWSTNGATGPQKVGNYNMRRNRNTPKQGFVIKSLYAYKKLVFNSKKAKQAAARATARANARAAAKRRAKRTARRINANRRREQAASLRKYGSRRHEHHHYKKHRKGR